jgi:hypothetical protein
MSNVPIATLLLPLSIGWCAVAIVNGNSAGAAPRAPTAKLPACEIRVDQSGNTIILEGLVFGRPDVSGSYHMEVRQRGLGSSAISQNGDFRVPANTYGSLGIVSLSKGVGSYLATLTVSWGDGTADCVAQAPKTRKVKLLDKKSDTPGASGLPQAHGATVQPQRGAPDLATE